jgi:two-component system sensor histidine kinase FlrB
LTDNSIARALRKDSLMVAIGSDIRFASPPPSVPALPRALRPVAPPSLDEILDALPSALLVLDDNRVVVEANSHALSLLGDDVLGAYWAGSATAEERPMRHGTLVCIGAASKAPNTELQVASRSQAVLAHQIRNPLTVAGLSVERLLATEDDCEARERLERVRGSLQAIEHQIRNALVFVRGELSERHTFAVSELVAALREAWSTLLDGHRVVWTEAYGDRDFVAGDLATLVGALTNIVDNAVTIGGGDVTISIAIDASRGRLRIAIGDDGPGMDAMLLSRAREPFFTGRAGGTGLGLAIVDAVVKAHDGVFALESALGEGTCARIELPLFGERDR